MGTYLNPGVDDGWSEVARPIRDSEGLLEALLASDGDAVAAGVERAHEDAASVLTYHDENSLACTLRLALHTATRRWRLIWEAPAGKDDGPQRRRGDDGVTGCAADVGRRFGPLRATAGHCGRGVA